MYRGLHFKIILIFVIFSITIMLSLGAVMIVGAFNYYKEDFSTHMTSAFDENSELVGQLTSALDEDDSVARQKEILRAYATSIGLSQYRNFYILSTDGEFLDGSDVAMMDTLGITPNILAAMRGEKGDGSRFGTGYIDYAAYLSSGENGCIIYVIDSQQDARDFMTMVLSLLGQALIVVMILAIALSFFLAKAITSPIRKLTDIAKKISDGNYEENADIVANDEIGTLSDTINNMKDVIKTTLDQKTSEQRKFETLFVYLYDAVIVFDRRGSMMHINRMARKIFHMPKTGTETILEPFNFAQMIKILGIDYEGASKEYTEKKNVVFRDVIIEEKAYDVTFAEFKYADKSPDTDPNFGIMCVIHDNTGRYELDKSRREFVSDVSHELRTPLTAIKGALETIIEYPDIDVGIRNNFLNMAVEECDRMTRIVGDLLILSRLDSNRTSWKVETFDVPAFLNHLKDVMSVDAKNHDQTLTCEYDSDIPQITGDREKLQQVLVNIVSNSIKYTADGGKIEIKAKKETAGVVICVADNGMGIPEEDLPRLFERFYRVEKARTSNAGGSGLGLAIAKEIVDAHGGNIWVQSTLGVGTKMYLFLPYVSSLATQHE
ncbi:MAG: HAMP domain-containing protein [Clostridia bacterium]|nr:HAMP domain-containing protein [Clostridia bacterium]